MAHCDDGAPGWVSRRQVVDAFQALYDVPGGTAVHGAKKARPHALGQGQDRRALAPDGTPCHSSWGCPGPRAEAIADRADAAELRTAVDSLTSRLDSLTNEMYSPDAEVTYDVLAKGTRLYSRLSPLHNWAAEGDGAPTQGVESVRAEQKVELQGYLDRFQQLLEVDLVRVNALAQRLGVPWVVVKERPKVIS